MLEEASTFQWTFKDDVLSNMLVKFWVLIEPSCFKGLQQLNFKFQDKVSGLLLNFSSF